MSERACVKRKPGCTCSKLDTPVCSEDGFKWVAWRRHPADSAAFHLGAAEAWCTVMQLHGSCPWHASACLPAGSCRCVHAPLPRCRTHSPSSGAWQLLCSYPSGCEAGCWGVENYNPGTCPVRMCKCTAGALPLPPASAAARAAAARLGIAFDAAMQAGPLPAAAAYARNATNNPPRPLCARVGLQR